MKNVTVTLKEEVARWARIRAAEGDVSVSRYLGQLLETEMRRERSYAQAMEASLERAPRALKTGGRYPTRDEIHDRAHLRR